MTFLQRLTIGGLAEELNKLKIAGHGNLPVHFDFDNSRPEGFGVHGECTPCLAIGSGHECARPWTNELPLIEAGFDNPDLDYCTNAPKGGHTVSSLLKAADIVQTLSFEGFEFGMFQVEPDTDLVAADYNEESWNHIGVSSIRLEGGRAILVTDL